MQTHHVTPSHSQQRDSAKKSQTWGNLGLDGTVKSPVFYARMTVKKGGGASRRGSHRLATAGGCEVRWYWAHHVKAQPTQGRYYLDYGTLMHTALAYHYAAQMERTPTWYRENPDARAALEVDAQGTPAWLRKCEETMTAYRGYYAIDAWQPMFAEEEFEARVGDIDPLGEDAPAFEVPYEVNGEPRTLSFPALSDEIVTCRPDLIVEQNGHTYIVDHKTASGARDGSGRLPVIDERHPDFTYAWQSMVNLHIVRKGRPTDMPEHPTLDVKGFIFNRIKRDAPYDFSRDVFDVAARQYAKVPATIRACVRRERALAVKAVRAPRDLVAHPWECQSRWRCDYTSLCHVDSLEERNAVLATQFTEGV
jgi:hypothetical protein